MMCTMTLRAPQQLLANTIPPFRGVRSPLVLSFCSRVCVVLTHRGIARYPLFFIIIIIIKRASAAGTPVSGNPNTRAPRPLSTPHRLGRIAPILFPADGVRRSARTGACVASCTGMLQPAVKAEYYAMAESTSSGPSSSTAERGAAALSAVTPPGCRQPRCQVPGCTTDMSAAKNYYKRYRICSGAPQPEVRGAQRPGLQVLPGLRLIPQLRRL